MFERISEDVFLSAVFGERLSSIGFIVYKIFHTDGYKWRSIVVVLVAHVCIG